jgi:peptidylprolyl isomerase
MRAVCCLFLLTLLGPMLPLRAQREKLSWDDRVYVEKTWPKAIKTSTGLRYLVLKPGSGKATPRPGDLVTVLFQGRLLDGKVFNECLDPAHPFQVRVGRDQLIPAWEETLKEMKRGEKRLIIVPYELGYGTRGDPPRIPRMATLVFEIELVGITREKE